MFKGSKSEFRITRTDEGIRGTSQRGEAAVLLDNSRELKTPKGRSNSSASSDKGSGSEMRHHKESVCDRCWYQVAYL